MEFLLHSKLAVYFVNILDDKKKHPSSVRKVFLKPLKDIFWNNSY